MLRRMWKWAGRERRLLPWLWAGAAYAFADGGEIEGIDPAVLVQVGFPVLTECGILAGQALHRNEVEHVNRAVVVRVADGIVLLAYERPGEGTPLRLPASSAAAPSNFQ